jgi:hypothetical protein
MLRLVLANLYPDESHISVWAYAVHGKSKAFFDRAGELRQSKTETAIKEQAIRCHKTQLKLSRRRFLAYGVRPERFLKLRVRESTLVDGPIRGISRHAHVLRVKLQLSAKPMSIARPKLFVLGHDATGSIRCVRMQVPVHSSTVELLDCHTGERLILARYRGDAFAGEFTIPLNIFSDAHALFVKLERRSWFFDEAGWLETAPTVADTALIRRVRTRSIRAEVLF